MTNKEIDKLDLAKFNEDSKKGLIFQVDLEYPEEMHDTQTLQPRKSAFDKTLMASHTF